MARKKIIVLAGPTASGKSALALAIAQESDAVIINADSMQLYAAIPILSAQPTALDKAAAPHLLYGTMPATVSCSAGMWLAMAKEAIDSTLAEGRQPIIVGGTGLYVKSLLYGLSPMPDIDPSIRTATRNHFAALGNEAFHALLTVRDPLMASRLHKGDSQRMIRSMEVLEQTGISLAEWQKQPPLASYNIGDFITITLTPPRPILYRNCNSRFCTMLEHGAVDEVASLLQKGIDPALPVMKALGVPELSAYLAGSITREDATLLAQISTRHYAKRQVTWFRHQMPESLFFTYEGMREERQAIIAACL